MLTVSMKARPPAASASSPSSGAGESPFSFLSKGWREVRDSATADLRLMRARADSFNRELENFLHSAAADAPIAELEFVKRLQPKLSEIRRTYSSTEFSRRVLERYWGPKSTIRIDLSAIRNAIVAEVDEFGGVWDLGKPGVRGRRRVQWKSTERQDEKGREWEPIRMIKSGLKEFEHKSQSNEIFGNFKSSEFVEKLKLSLRSLYKEPQESKEVPPLDLPELLAYFLRQSRPFFDQLGVRREIYDKIEQALCSRHKDSLVYRSSSSMLGNDDDTDEFDLRIANVLRSTGHHYDGGFWNDPALTNQDRSDKKRHVAIVTTASLPWMTGTAVNPLFRAAYLARSTGQDVTLLLPWLCKSDQELVYPSGTTFSSPEDQEAFIRSWVEERLGFKADFNISFYPGKFAKERRSIIPAGDTSQFISSKEADIAILEEPEHLNWYHHGRRWTDKFNHVIGVVHTNYLEYIKREKFGAMQAFFVRHINNLVARAYCHKVLRLSAATQDLPKSVVCNVHGVNPKFLKVGEEMAAKRGCGQQAFSKGAYFLGKMVWAKGYRELLYLLAKHKSDLEGFNLDVYGSGEDSHEVQSSARKLDLNLNFFKGRDHADDSLHGYKVFINPSISDVLCTATAEALAMGKFVICADHPSNDFFRAFPNCLTYKSSEDFVARVKEAMARDPQPLTDEQRYNLSWEAATTRFMESSELDKVLSVSNTGKIRKVNSMPNLSEVVDGGLSFLHYCFTGSEILRLATGAIPNSRDYDKHHCTDLHLLPPQVQHPVYGW